MPDLACVLTSPTAHRSLDLGTAPERRLTGAGWARSARSPVNAAAEDDMGR